jgi:hypothetical protein
MAMKKSRPVDLVEVSGLLLRETRCRIKLQFNDVRGKPRVVVFDPKYHVARVGGLVVLRIPRYMAYQNKLEVRV